MTGGLVRILSCLILFGMGAEALHPLGEGVAVVVSGAVALAINRVWKVQRAVSRYGFGHPVTEWTHRDFLEEVVRLSIEGLYERETREHGEDPTWEDPTGILHDFELEAAREGVILGAQYFRRRERSTVVELAARVGEARVADGGGERGE